jgi:hypothetical protein
MADRTRINLSEEHEVQYWSERVGLTPERLREVVNEVGNSVERVREKLGWQGPPEGDGGRTIHMDDSNLQGCPDRKDIQMNLAKATYELCAVKEALDATQAGPVPIPNSKALDDQLAAVNGKHAEISGRLADHTTQTCPACAELLRKTA